VSQIPVIFTKIMFLLFYIQIICFSEIFLSQPILLELEAPLKICGKKILTYCILGTRGVCPVNDFWTPPRAPRPPINFVHDEISKLVFFLLLFRVRLRLFPGRALRLGQARGPSAAATLLIISMSNL